MNRRSYESLLSHQVKNKKKQDKIKKDVVKNDRRRLDRLKRPRPYIKKNYLGIPIAIKASNITGFSARVNELKYNLNPSPKRLIICARRAIRKEVLFAKGGIGNGKRVKSRRIFTQDSKIKC